MKEELLQIRTKAMEQIEAAKGTEALNEIRVSLLGKKGEMTAILKGMKDVSPEDRPKVGQMVNETREAIENKLAEAKKRLDEAEMKARLEKETIDVTLPAKRPLRPPCQVPTGAPLARHPRARPAPVFALIIECRFGGQLFI